MHKNTPKTPSQALHYSFDGSSDYIPKTRLKMETTGCKPNYPLGAFCRFSELRRVELKEEFPKWPQTKIFQRIKQDWKKLENKQAYRDQAKKDYQDYKVLLEEWELKQAGEQPRSQSPPQKYPVSAGETVDLPAAEQKNGPYDEATKPEEIGKPQTLQNPLQLGSLSATKTQVDPKAPIRIYSRIENPIPGRSLTKGDLSTCQGVPSRIKDSTCAAVLTRRGSEPGVLHSLSSGLDIVSDLLRDDKKLNPSVSRPRHPSPAPAKEARPLDIQNSLGQRLPPSASDTSRSIWTSEDDLALQRETAQLTGFVMDSTSIEQSRTGHQTAGDLCNQLHLGEGRGCLQSTQVKKNEDSRIEYGMLGAPATNLAKTYAAGVGQPSMLRKRSIQLVSIEEDREGEKVPRR